MTFQLPDLFPHQKPVVEFIEKNPKCGVWLGIGGAKTLSTLTALFNVKPTGHILVIAPLAIARSTWLNEIDKWGFPLRTKSLIVDENDKKLSAEDRLQRFQEIHTDPPTMYFINNETLTRPSQDRHVAKVRDGFVPDLLPDSATDIQKFILKLLTDLNYYPTNNQLVELIQQQYPKLDNNKTVTKTAINKAIRDLKKQEFLINTRLPCLKCNGKGCNLCKHGLIDQLPKKTVKQPNGQNKTVIDWPFSTVIIDESHLFKNGQSKRFKALANVSSQSTRLIELTGTPSPQNLLDIWAQMYLIDQGVSLGRTFTEYRARYFRPTLMIDNRPVKWEIIPGRKEDIYKAVAPFVISTENANLPILPPIIDPIEVILPKHLKEAYKEFVKEQVLTLASPDPNDPKHTVITADNAAALHSKLLQFASGAIYTGNKKEYNVIHTDKLEMLEYLIDNANGNVLVGYRFQFDKELIYNHLKKKGHKVEIFDTSRDMTVRWNDKEIDVMLIHPQSGGPGLNLQDGGHTLIWYTLPDSLSDYQQLNGRITRIGQQKNPHIMYLTTKGTRDEKLPLNLKLKDQEQKGLINAVKVDTALYYDDIEDILGDLDINPL